LELPKERVVKGEYSKSVLCDFLGFCKEPPGGEALCR